VAEFLAQESLARRGLVAFVEEQIQRREHTIKARREVLTSGQLEAQSL
jgi:hypothetical protein